MKRLMRYLIRSLKREKENIIFAVLFTLFSTGPATLVGSIVLLVTQNDVIGNSVFFLVFAADIVGMFLWARRRAMKRDQEQEES